MVLTQFDLKRSPECIPHVCYQQSVPARGSMRECNAFSMVNRDAETCHFLLHLLYCIF